VRDLPRRVAELQCRKLFDCCTPAQIATAGSLIVSFTDEAGCVTEFQNFFERATPRQEAAITAGRVIYNSGEVAACLARIDAMTCDVLTSGSVPSCDAWTPLQQDGEACESDAECISTLCEFGIGPTSQRTCARPAGLGEPCAGACEEGAACDFDTSTCVLAKRIGESCLANSECESTRCDPNTSVCVPDSICPP
jgi:hypothetical protein